MKKIEVSKDLWMIVGILAVLVIFFYKFVFLGMIPLNAEWLNSNYYPWKALGKYAPPAFFNNDTDPVLYMYPIKYITIQIMKAGHLPLWNPYILCGAPLWGNNFSCPLNPLNIVFFIFNFATAWGIFLMLQFAVAGLGMYLFLREKGVVQIGAGIAAVAWMLNITFVIWFQTMSYLGVYSWLPLAFFMVEKVFRSKSFIAAFWCGVVFALFVWCGLIQLAAYSIFFSLAYMAFRFFQSIAADRGSITRYIWLCLTVAVVAALYTLPELIVQKTNIANSTRTPTRYGLSLLYPQMLLTYVSPYFYGTKYDGWDLGFGTYIFNRGLIRLAPPYIGILPIVMAVAGFFTRKDKDRFFYLLFSAGILIALMLFALPFVYRPILKYIPFFGSVDHYRLTTIYAFSMCVMAGWGLHSLFSDGADRRLGIRIAIFACICMISIFAVVYAISYINIKGLSSAFSYFKQSVPPFLFDRTHSLKSVYAFFDYLHMLSRQNGAVFFSKEVAVPVVFAVITIVTMIGLAKSRRRALIGVAAFAFVAADLLYYGLVFPAYSKASDVFPKTPSSDFLAAQPGIFRVLGYSERTASPKGDLYPPNSGMMYGLQDIRGYENIGQIKWYYRYIMGENPDEIVIERFNDYDSESVSLMNVKYLMSSNEIRSQTWKLVYDKEIKIYENTLCLPRVFIKDMRNNTVISGAEVVSYRPYEVTVKLDGKANGLIVLSDAYFPGWRAFVDGKEKRIEIFDSVFRALRVSAGERNARFLFSPKWFYELFYLCAGIFLVVIILSIVKIITLRYSKCPR